MARAIHNLPYKNIFITYQINDKLTGEYYRGKTNLWRWIYHNYYGSGKIFKRRMKKYGKGRFDRQILDMFDNEEEAYSNEVLIVKTMEEDPKSTNLKVGGEGSLSGKDNPFYGKTHTKAVRDNLRKINIGRKHTQEAKDKIGRGHKGRVPSEESKAKMSLGKTKYTEEYLLSIYDPTKLLKDIATINGVYKLYLRDALARWIVKNDLPRIPNQRVILYQKKKALRNGVGSYDLFSYE